MKRLAEEGFVSPRSCWINKKHLHKMGEEKLKSVFYAGKQACCERFFMPDYTWNMVIFRHLPITTR